jgi:hypothetical protein
MWLSAALFSAIVALICAVVSLIYWVAFPQALGVYALVGSGTFVAFVSVQVIRYTCDELDNEGV